VIDDPSGLLLEQATVRMDHDSLQTKRAKEKTETHVTAIGQFQFNSDTR